MIYVYDILLNWFQKEQLVDFFEWELNDELEHIKKIPLFKVNSTCIKDLCTSHIEIDHVFLEKIKDKTECYFHSEVDTITYACLFSDGSKCVALEFDEEAYTTYKSTLLIDEEEEVLELVEELTTTKIDYHIKKCNTNYDYLTRKERNNKNYILKELKNIWQHQDTEKMTYLYEEYFNDSTTSLDEMYQKLKTYIMRGYSNIHDEIIQILRLTSPHGS